MTTKLWFLPIGALLAAGLTYTVYQAVTQLTARLPF